MYNIIVEWNIGNIYFRTLTFKSSYNGTKMNYLWIKIFWGDNVTFLSILFFCIKNNLKVRRNSLSMSWFKLFKISFLKLNFTQYSLKWKFSSDFDKRTCYLNQWKPMCIVLIFASYIIVLTINIHRFSQDNLTFNI